MVSPFKLGNDLDLEELKRQHRNDIQKLKEDHNSKYEELRQDYEQAMAQKMTELTDMELNYNQLQQLSNKQAIIISQRDDEIKKMQKVIDAQG